MGLLNYLFGNKKERARNLVMDDKKRLALWNKHLTNYDLRYELSNHFNFRNIDKALHDFKSTDKVLKKIEALISPELVTIEDEEKTDEKIFTDINQFTNYPKIIKLGDDIVWSKQKQKKLLKLFHEMFNLLKVELQYLREIGKRPENVRELLLRLYELIHNYESNFYHVFSEECYNDENKYIHKHIVKIARAIILEEEIKEEIESVDEKFVTELVHGMDPSETKRRYMDLGNEIYEALAEKAGSPFSSADEMAEGINKIEKILKNDRVMHEIAKRLKPEWNDVKLNSLILAFRRAYSYSHFADLEYDLLEESGE